ncbi:MAG: rod shape-determining protein [Lachnospiraceae bacterium]|nr:rod shape-determining protein [Lachnospiraceae bacterium]MBR3004818.1 rod shape-determining protein [Lachnospiraceae bacterium]MBR6350558.1 rod shape-determining protein [Lachnospiraceae bacterium]
MSDKYGIDIGTCNVRLSYVNTGEILTEKNVITIKDRKLVLGYGDDAYEMFEKAPENIEVIFPVVDGVISDIDKMQLILEHLYKKLNYGKNVRGSDFLIAVPTDTTEVEKRAFHELVANSKIKPRSISVVEKSVADSVYCGVDIESPRGNIIVNIGADTTDISVVSLGGIVLCNTIKVAGNKINEAIINAVKQAEAKLIGMKSAEQLKFNLVDLGLRPVHKEMKLFGRVLATGLPVRTTIGSELINPVVAETIEPIIDAVKRTLEKTPPELAADIVDNGMYLLGGSANMKNIDSLFNRETGLKVNLMPDPINSTIKGVTKIMSSSKYDSVRYFPQEKVYN